MCTKITPCILNVVIQPLGSTNARKLLEASEKRSSICTLSSVFRCFATAPDKYFKG